MSIADSLAEVHARLREAERRAGRAAGEVKLVAVSKTVPAERVRVAIAAGQVALGESYAQELRDKAPLCPGARWHFIGPLQRNKVKYVVGTAELIQSIDSASLAAEIAARAQQKGIVQRCLLQVHLGDEPQKSGCPADELPALLDLVRAHASLSVEGLMGIPPAAGDPRPHFRALRELAARHGLHELSMGMSADYEAAIAEGATLVRIGSAIFGARS